MKKILKKITPQRLQKIVRSVMRLEAMIEEINLRISVLERHDNRLDEAKILVNKVEQYQPTYGVSGIVTSPARAESYERARAIENYFGDVAGKNVLDIGSSLGFFSYYLSDRGSRCEGWESNLDNCEAARAIGRINGIDAEFKIKELNTETVRTIKSGQFDVVMILSVFHHIIRFQGLEVTQKLVADLLNKIPVMVVELAKKGEDDKLPWDKYQPDDELDIFKLVKDKVEIKKIGNFGNHLSSNTRPLYIIELKKKIKVGNREYSYNTVETTPYKGSGVPFGDVRRKYYFSDSVVIKEYSFNEKSRHENMPQILSEISTLIRLEDRKIHKLPKFLSYDLSDPEYAKVAIERTKGVLLSDIKDSISVGRAEKIVRDVLRTTSDLEREGLYHNDIRSWNVIVDKDKASLIDYGLVSPIDSDNNAIAILWLIDRILSGAKEGSAQAKTELPNIKNFKKSQWFEAVYNKVKKDKSVKLSNLLRLQDIQ